MGFVSKDFTWLFSEEFTIEPGRMLIKSKNDVSWYEGLYIQGGFDFRNGGKLKTNGKYMLAVAPI